MKPFAHYFFFTLMFACAPYAASAATLSLSPSAVSVHAGDSFIEKVIVSSADQAANAISGTLNFPADLLSAVVVSKSNSVLTLWVQDPSFSNSDGTVDWSGVVPNPGFTGGSGVVFSVTFTAKKSGQGRISFSSSSVLANDGSGTNILTSTQSSAIAVAEPAAPAPAPTPAPAQSVNSKLLATIMSSSHPDQSAWYPATHVVLDWTNAQGVVAVKLGYDRDLQGTPGVLYTEPISHKEIDLTEGVSYFHVQEKDASGWGSVSTFAIHIGTAPALPASTATTSTSTPPASALTTNGFSGFLPTILPFGLLIIILLLVMWVWHLERMVPHAGRRRTGRAHLLVHQEFSGLKSALSSELLKFQHMQTKRELNKEEERFFERMEKMITKAEQAIDRQIDEIR